MCELSTTWFICMYHSVAADILDTPTKQEENVSQTLLHTVSRKHVIQPGNHSKALCNGLSFNVPLICSSSKRQGPVSKTGLRLSQGLSCFQLKQLKQSLSLVCEPGGKFSVIWLVSSTFPSKKHLYN